MHATFTEQLGRVDLTGFTIGPPPPVTQTLEGVWSDLFALLCDTALEAVDGRRSGLGPGQSVSPRSDA